MPGLGKRVVMLSAVGAALCPARARGQEVTAVARGGVYADSDHTQVYRSLGAAQVAWRHFGLHAQEEVDVVSSASTDVRASPFLDALSGASPVSPTMSDIRYETTVAGSWNDGDGHTASLQAVYATERDYTSLGGGVTASWDLAQRNTTLLGGLNATTNDVTSIADPKFRASLSMVGYSIGVAQIVTPSDAARIRYDGGYLDGYQASPYRAVRFGNWHTALRPGGAGLLFLGTIGSPNGLPEKLPGTRLRHAGSIEWLHALARDVGLAAQYRVAYDDWGVLAHTLGTELRIARWQRWQARASYRFYFQDAADFWQTKYVSAPEAYQHYTSDKELGRERGHSASVDGGYSFWRRPGGRLGALVDVKVEYLYYAYPGFALLSDRSSVFGEIGLRLDF